jgi:hypothetical protein
MRVTVVSEAHLRFERIAEARSLALWPVLGLFVLWWWSFFAGAFLMPGVFVSLCVPPAAWWAARRWPTLVTLWGNKRKDLRASLSGLVGMGSVVPLRVAYKLLNCDGLLWLVLPGVLFGGWLAHSALKHDEALRERRQDAAYLGLNLMIYAATLALWLNHALPAVSTLRAPVRVAALRTHQNIRGPAVFDVQLSGSPFDDDDDGDELYSVPRQLWEQLQVGSAVCLRERTGVFGVAEAAISACPAGTRR